MREILPTLILLAGLGQFSLLFVASLLPSKLRWREELAPLPRMHRQMHWIYAGYVVLAFTTFALISVTLPHELASGTPLARSLCGYIAVFWSVRLCLQGVFDATPYLTAWWLKLGYRMLTVLFTYLAVVYAVAALWP